MKTPDYWHHRIVADDTIVKHPLCNKTELECRLAIIAEIQRDAREGMVEASDIEPLYNAVKLMLTHSEPESTKHYVANQALTLFRAKHPNLFTK